MRRLGVASHVAVQTLRAVRKLLSLGTTCILHARRQCTIGIKQLAVCVPLQPDDWRLLFDTAFAAPHLTAPAARSSSSKQPQEPTAAGGAASSAVQELASEVLLRYLTDPAPHKRELEERDLAAALLGRAGSLQLEALAACAEPIQGQGGGGGPATGGQAERRGDRAGEMLRGYAAAVLRAAEQREVLAALAAHVRQWCCAQS